MGRTKAAGKPKAPKKRANISESESSPEKKQCHDTPSRQAAECLSKLKISTPSRNTRSQCNLTESSIGDVMKRRDTNKRQLFPRETRSSSKSPARATLRRRKESTSPEVFKIEDSEMEIDEDSDTENISPSRPSISFPPRRKPATNELETMECYTIRSIVLKKVEVIQKDGSEDVVRYRVRTMNTPRGVIKQAKRNALEDLRSLLHTSEVPENMPCREDEFETIRKFIIQGVKKNSTSQAMYISGVPGTGKTATTQAVIKEVGKHYKFKYAAVNAMELMEPKQIFVEIFKGILPNHLPIGCKKIMMSFNTQELMLPNKLVDPKVEEPIVVVIGGIAKGKISVDYTEQDVKISNYPLSAALCCAKVTSGLEEIWGII